MHYRIWKIYYGLAIIWNKDWQKVQVETCNKSAWTTLLLDMLRIVDNHASLIDTIEDLLYQQWEVRVDHVLCEANLICSLLPKKI